jgi:hypothetical protein
MGETLPLEGFRSIHVVMGQDIAFPNVGRTLLYPLPPPVNINWMALALITVVPNRWEKLVLL